MRRLVIASSALLTLGACGGGSAPLTDETIPEVLLTLEEMPTGYTADPSLLSAADAEKEKAVVSRGPQECGELAESLERSGQEPEAQGDAGYRGSETGPFFYESVAAFTDADKVLDEFRTTVANCDVFTTTDPASGSDITYTFSARDVAQLGDEGVAVSMRVEFAGVGMPIDQSIIVTRVDSVLVTTSTFGLGTTMQPNLYNELTSSAVDKVAGRS